METARYRIDPAELITTLGRDTKNRIGSFAFFDIIDSTNDYLMTKKALPTHAFALCMAAQQVRGRGRRGRVWISPASGNIYLSLGWKPTHQVVSDHWFGLMAALSIARYLSSQSPSFVGVKWPNDLYCNERKLGGILLDAASDRYVIGLGLNVTSDKLALDEMRTQCTSLEDMQVDLSGYTDLVVSIIQTIIQAVDCVRTRTVQSIKKWYHPYDLIYGRTIMVRCNGNVLSGVAAGVNNEGMLQLKTERGLRLCDINQSSVYL